MTQHKGNNCRRVLKMARGGRAARVKNCGCPAMSSLSLVCGSALVCIALFSIICGRLLDLGDVQLSGPDPVPFSVRRSNTLDEVTSSSGKELQDLEDVPAEGDSSVKNVWFSKNAELYHGCSAASYRYAPESSIVKNGYVTIQASGGLNQQRTGITDSVAVARILNATLVIPEMDHASFWDDDSNFDDIFDVEHFISVLAPDVRVIKELPMDVQESSPASRMRVPRKSPPSYYESKVLKRLLSKQVVRLTKFDYRLSNKLEDELQKLRCRANYKALKFTEPIAQMGQSLVERMRKGGRYIALHLRFEPDMLAFTGCYYGGGSKEIKELGEIRKRWRSLGPADPERARRNGKCPLSPTEMGLLLRASGFGDDTHLYVASGEVYGGEEALAPLRALFPKFYTKDSLSFENELNPFQNYSSRMAAIDYIVCDESDVFVANNNGNMARIIAGHRRFNGHKRTIRPNGRKLSPLFLTRKDLGWEQFAEKVRHAQKGYMGDPYEGGPGKGDFHENPAACICNADGRSLVELAQEPKGSNKQQGRLDAKPTTGEMKWPEVEEDIDAGSESVKIDSEETVHTGFIGEEVLDSVKEDARLEAKLEEVEDISLVTWNILDRGFVAQGKLHRMTPHGIDVYDIDKNDWQFLSDISLRTLSTIWPIAILKVHKEILALVPFNEKYIVLRSRGFGTQNKTIAWKWKKVKCPRWFEDMEKTQELDKVHSYVYWSSAIPVCDRLELDDLQ